MQRLMLWVIAMVATPGSLLFAQDGVGTPPPKAMAADAHPQFGWPPSKQNQSRETGGTFRVSPGGLFNATNFPVTVLIQFAYNVPSPPDLGWTVVARDRQVRHQRGKPDAGAPNLGQLRVMLQKLLADRFQLSLHREKKELPAYALTVANGGPKLTEDTDHPNGLPAFFGGGPQGRPVQNSTMADFASDLQGTVPDRPVVDQTGLGSKRYDFVLKWTPLAPATSAVGPRR